MESNDKAGMRGNLFEVVEIEARLLEHPGVVRAGVVAKAHDRTGARLVAFVVPHSGNVPSSLELKNHLSAFLPGHMVPGAFVMREALPLAADGQIDREGLLELAWDGDDTAYCAPRTGLQEQLCAIFAQELNGVEEIGLDDNFFALGGDSLAAIRAMVGLEAAVGIRLPASKLFEQPTVRELAHYIESGAKDNDLPQTDQVGVI